MVYVMLADGFEEIEALAVVDILRRAGIDVLTASITDGYIVTGTHNIKVTADTKITDTALEDAEMVVLPGGMPGTNNLFKSKPLEKALDNRVKKGKWIAAICAAPMILGKRGYLDGREATCYPGFEKDLKGAVIKDQKVVISGNFITSKGPGAALQFALAIVSILKDQQTALKLQFQMQM